jgi:hypothetical protein
VTFVSSRTICPLASVITVIIEVRHVDQRLVECVDRLSILIASPGPRFLRPCIEAILMTFDGGQGATSIDRSEEQPFFGKNPHTTTSEVEVCNHTAHMNFADQKSLSVPDVDSIVYTAKVLCQQIV